MSSKTESRSEKNTVVELIKDEGPSIEKSEDSSIVLTKKKEKSKRQKKRENNNENISVVCNTCIRIHIYTYIYNVIFVYLWFSQKSSFNKFDALQKRNLIHVRSSDSSKAQEVFSVSKSFINTNI